MSTLQKALIGSNVQNTKPAMANDDIPIEKDVVETTETDDDAALTATNDDSNIVVLDWKTADRQYHSDPYTALQREIWRPGT